MSFTPVRSLACAAALLMASFSSQATLIINGDFEANAIKPGSWTSLSSNRVDGWQGSNIEIWNALNGVHAVSGNHFIELNANGANQGPWSIFQSFDTDIGQQYQLSFYYRARSNNNEQFELSLGDTSWLFDDHTTQGWAHYNNYFVAKTSSMILRFTSLNAGTMGNLLDDVKVVAAPVQPQSLKVAEASTLSVLALGLVLLALRRRGAKAE